jgi:hypothetical protein
MPRDLSAQNQLGLLHLLIELETQFLLNVFSLLLGAFQQAGLFAFGIFVQGRAQRRDLFFQVGDAQILRFEFPLRVVAQARGLADIVLELLVAGAQGFVHGTATEVNQNEEQDAEVQELQRERLLAEGNVFSVAAAFRVLSRVPTSKLRILGLVTHWACVFWNNRRLCRWGGLSLLSGWNQFSGDLHLRRHLWRRGLGRLGEGTRGKREDTSDDE